MKPSSNRFQSINYLKNNFAGVILPLLFIALAIVLRLLPHPPNFTPLAAIALFGGTYLSRRWAVLIVLSAMLISDYFIGFHSTMPYVYGSFLLIILLGYRLRDHITPLAVFGSSIAGSLIFFIVTNFGAWLNMGMYPKTASGLLDAYVMGIPFYRNTLIGDVFYATMFFGCYELTKYVIKRRLVWQKTSN